MFTLGKVRDCVKSHLIQFSAPASGTLVPLAIRMSVMCVFKAEQMLTLDISYRLKSYCHGSRTDEFQVLSCQSLRPLGQETTKVLNVLM